MSKLSNEVRTRIAHEVLSGVPDHLIVNLLAGNGLTKEAVEAEIAQAKNHPYLSGAQVVVDKLAEEIDDQTPAEHARLANNLSWLCGTFDKLANLDPEFGTIQRIKPVPFDQFVSEYISRNRPVIIRDAMHDWPAYQKWSFDYFRAVHGDVTVGIQEGRSGDPLYERNSGHLKSAAKFADFLDRVESTEKSNDFYMTAGNMTEHKSELTTIFEDADQSNIFGEYFREPQAGSLWVGPRGTVTPLHFDMINNFLCQITGRKRIRLAPSWSLPWMYNDYHVYSEVDLLQVDAASFPQFEKVTFLDFVLYPGEIVFIPVGWWHHLEALDPSISLTRKTLNLPSRNGFGDGFSRG